MISDEDVKQLFQNTWRIQSKHWDRNSPLFTQFFRGTVEHIWENQHPGGCERHMSVFSKFNIIPKFCFNCYKVTIEPRTVVELFKLMMVFEQLGLPNDNARKCSVECRDQVPGTYKGFIYCIGIEEGKEVLKIVQRQISEEISKNIPVILKRGCSEYTASYPEYAQIEQGTEPMSYKDEWQKYEDLADRNMFVNAQSFVGCTANHPTYTAQDAQVMLAWLKYAATIGDISYLSICSALQPFPDLNRPFPYNPVEDE